MSTATEWHLIQQCRRGRTAAFEPLVLGYQGEARAIARAMLLDPDDAEDAVQDAFVRAFQSLGSLAKGSPFGPWFRTIVRRICIDRLRAPAHARREALSDDVDRAAWVEPIGTMRLERAQIDASIKQGLAMLSIAHREVLVMKEIEGLGYAEIAKAQGVSEGTVASRIFHARAALKRILSRQGIQSADAEGA